MFKVKQVASFLFDPEDVGDMLFQNMAGETGGLGENVPQCHLVHHKSHMT
jgi:hypothetical protein